MISSDLCTNYINFCFAALGQGLAASSPQHMMQLTPLLYSYQMAMAQVANAAGTYILLYFHSSSLSFFRYILCCCII